MLGGIVHLATVLLLPRTATQDAYTRLAASGAGERHRAPARSDAGRGGAAVHGSGLRYGGVPLRSRRRAAQAAVPVSQAYTSVSFYARSGVAYYAINDRAAGRRTIELDLMTTQQRAEMPDDEEVTAADRLIVESPTPTGLILVRAFGPEPGLMPMARRALASRSAARKPEATS